MPLIITGVQCSRIRILHFFSDFQKHDFLGFFLNGISKGRKVVSKSLVLNRQNEFNFIYNSLSDHCNSIPSSRSVIHSEPLLNILFDVGDRDLPVLTSGNCVIKG